MQISLYEIILYFVIYSFLGWVMESVYRSICEKKLINTGFLYGPFCPIYGVGAILMLLFLSQFSDNIFVLFLVSFIAMTAWEYIVGVGLEKAFKTKYWDYSDHKFNFQGRICLTNSIAWGVIGVVFIKFIHPFIQDKIGFVDPIMLKYVIYVLMVIMIADCVISIVKVKNINIALKTIEQLNDEIKEKLKQVKEINLRKDYSKSEDVVKEITNLQKTINKLKRRQRRIVISVYRKVYNLKRAFPAVDTKEISFVLSEKFRKFREDNIEKIEIKKEEIKKKQEEIKRKK